MGAEKLMLLTGETALSGAVPLFDGLEDTLIQTALEGEMGSVWRCAGDGQPVAAFCMTGDFVFPAGDAEAPEALLLLEGLREQLDGRFAILTPPNELWSSRIRQVFGDRAKAGERYAIHRQKAFDTEKLTGFVSRLPKGVTLEPIAGRVYDLVMAEWWSRDFCSSFLGKEDFARRGLGVAALYNGELIGGASSYICFRGGIELEVDTREDWRRKGIATACCARLILTCMEKDLIPGWDAANRESVALAEKLGYRERGAYPVWFVNE
ncbi:MAG: GNAT family N-acetyltransferase [Clostridiales bacterium]|nr:GNAT family N-acetyltransferase [Clostridiales bacterium]